jgi:hypothetical protein
MRTTLTSSIVAVGLLAAGAGPALAGQAEPSRVQIVRVTKTPAADGGYSWAEGAIGAGLTAVVLLGAAGVAAGRRHPRVTA